MNAPLLTIPDVAAELRISPRSVQRLIAAGRIRVVHPSPGVTRIERRELDAYLAWLRRAA